MRVYLAGHGGDILREECWIRERGAGRLLAFADTALPRIMKVHREELRIEDLPTERHRRKP